MSKIKRYLDHLYESGQLETQGVNMFPLIKSLQEKTEQENEKYIEDVKSLSAELASKAKAALEKHGKDGNVDDILATVAKKMGIASSMIDDCVRSAKKKLAKRDDSE